MKLSEAWLREFLPELKMPRDALITTMTNQGLEIASCEPVSAPMQGVIVGQIISVRQHPEAPQLQVCQVTIGESKDFTVVCGASNARANLVTAFAQVGAQFQNKVIQAIEKKGIISSGMLVSASELGLSSEESTEIMELPDDAPLGQALYDYLQLDDAIIEVEITPNRGDALSHAGIARDLAAATNSRYVAPVSSENTVSFDNPVAIHVQAYQACPRYCARVIRGLHPQTKTPVFIQERLRRAGVRSISFVIDITNYVMLELGQPLHAFDVNVLKGSQINVRFANSGETIKLLNEHEVALNEQILVIADNANPIAIAGVMGSHESGVQSYTTDILLESAFFTPHLMIGTARRYGLNTEASVRFERGVDPELASHALERVTTLLLKYSPGEASAITEFVAKDDLPKQISLTLRLSRAQQILGMDISAEQANEILHHLGFQPRVLGEEIAVIVPSYRFDISEEIDLIEELVRIIGYEHVPIHRPQVTLVSQPAQSMSTVEHIRQSLINQGYQEVISYSFVAPAIAQQFAPHDMPLCLQNPISSEMSVMRTSLWPGLMQTLLYNLNRQCVRLKCFEIGRAYRSSINNNLPLQEYLLAGLCYGPVLPLQWGSEVKEHDFYDAKNNLMNLLRPFIKHTQTLRWIAADHPALHPGQSAHICIDEQKIGILGKLHPKIAHDYDIDQAVYLFEIELAKIQQMQVDSFEEISKYPSVARDLAFIIHHSVNADKFIETISKAVGEQLREVTIFDVYQGQHIPEGYKSVALRLTFSDAQKTLLDEEINQHISHVVTLAGKAFKAQLRQ